MAHVSISLIDSFNAHVCVCVCVCVCVYVSQSPKEARLTDVHQERSHGKPSDGWEGSRAWETPVNCSVHEPPLVPYSPAIQPHFRVGPWHCVVLCIVCLLHSGTMLVVGLLLFGCSGIGTTCNNCRGKTNEKGEKVWASLTESEYEQPNWRAPFTAWALATNHVAFCEGAPIITTHLHNCLYNASILHTPLEYWCMCQSTGSCLG